MSLSLSVLVTLLSPTSPFSPLHSYSSSSSLLLHSLSPSYPLSLPTSLLLSPLSPHSSPPAPLHHFLPSLPPPSPQSSSPPIPAPYVTPAPAPVPLPILTAVKCSPVLWIYSRNWNSGTKWFHAISCFKYVIHHIPFIIFMLSFFSANYLLTDSILSVSTVIVETWTPLTSSILLFFYSSTLLFFYSSILLFFYSSILLF